MRNRIVRAFLFCLGAVGIVAIFFFGTLYVLNAMDVGYRNATRMENIKLLKNALDRYLAAHGTYPAQLPDNSIEDLKPFLVSPGYLSAIPRDPLPGHTYRYAAGLDATTQRYGLRVYTEGTGDCVTGVSHKAVGWWSPTPNCPF